MEYFLIAKVEQTYGKNGYVRVRTLSYLPELFADLKKVYLDFWGDKKIFRLEDIKRLEGGTAFKFKRFDTLRDVQVLIDRDIYIDEEDKARLPETYFSLHDLIGSEVIVEEESIGSITEVINAKANDVLVIRSDDNDEKLFPFVLNFIEKFDVAAKKLILNISKDFFEDDQD